MPLEGFSSPTHPPQVCKLRKALYGLKQAPRAWFDKLKTTLLSWGFKNNTSDVSLFFYNAGSVVVYLLVYVDDILITENAPDLITKVIQDLNSQFALKVMGPVHFFLRFEVKRNASGLLLTQSKYAQDLLEKANMAGCNPGSTPMTVGTKLSKEEGELFDQPTFYRSIIGGLQYLTLSRPDLAFTVNKLSQFLQHPTIAHWVACKRVLRCIKGTLNHGLQFTKHSHLELETYVDTDWASDINDRRSTSGYAIFLGNNLVQWSSKKQKVVSLSSIEAEYRSLSQAATEVVCI
ncbi:uncharacterized protein LOC116141598 [Pistacia vera]|uniref:uncharacterized protein LOC116141598 n=1 Tax=Pistacia vera TaxID=55513 RepID=UPI001263CFF8|nr:uncharacterized protein LOC116141598 [Pistacia vera]